jgi:hypothetical protein
MIVTSFSVLIILFLADSYICLASDVSSFAYFNAIGAVLRTNASIRQPNGMTIFLASVPSKSILYHGTYHQNAVKGYEWVAFEPDFAYWFAQPRPTRPTTCATCKQHVLQQSENLHGYLHTYETKKDLRLILLDGLSAFKRSTGTQDLQDLLLLNNSMDCVPDHRGGMTCERQRASSLCHLSKERWNGTVDGFIRKDPEWEIILCSFEQQLHLLDVTSVDQNHHRLPPPSPSAPPRKDPKHTPGWSWNSNDLPNQDRDDTVIQSMVHVHFDRSVSMFDIDETLASQKLPRLLNLTDTNRETFMQTLDALVLTSPHSPDRRNLQRKADMLVTRYGPILQRARTGNFTKLPDIKDALEQVLRPYLSANEERSDVPSRRCALPYTVSGDATRPAQAVHVVAQHVCQALLGVRAATDYHEAMHTLRTMARELRWLSWPSIL